ncbi:hypothetical protein D3C80_2138020 [compost metagenome]
MTGRLPPGGKHLLHPWLGEALVDQQQHATVVITADNPPGGLDHLAHARVQVGIVEPRAKLTTQALFELLIDRVDLR